MHAESTTVSPFSNIKNPFMDRTASTDKSALPTYDKKPRLQILRVIGHGAFGKSFFANLK
jgi:hypothetical protein